MKHRNIFRLALVAIVGFAPTLGKALVIEQTLPELVRESDVIVRGTVAATTCRWGSPAYDPNSRIIFTDVRLILADRFKGVAADTELLIETEGGVVDDRGLKVEDQPEFQTGEDVIVFLSPQNQNNRRTVVGLFQGEFTLDQGRVIENQLRVEDFIREIGQIVQEQEQR